jgi:polar amino acid transport system permease protein
MDRETPYPVEAEAELTGAEARSLGGDIRAALTNPRHFWIYLMLGLAALMIANIYVNDIYNDAFVFLLKGVALTIRITLSSFVIAQVLGLVTALGRISKNMILYNIATFYVEVFRGIPIVVQLVYMAFVVFPALLDLVHGVGNTMMSSDIGFLVDLGTSWKEAKLRTAFPMDIRAIIALGIAYGAYEAEVYRAGIESIERGQMEAARSLGMTYVQAMRYVILPQAIRRVLPPIGNDFVALLKDSSLASVLAVNELTHQGELHRARTFRSFETLNTVTFLYLILTISFTRVVRVLERRLSTDD